MKRIQYGLAVALIIAAFIAPAARNGSGTYSLPSGNPVVSGTTISSTWANNTLTDIAGEITNSLARDGQSPATANIPMGSHKITGLSNGMASTDSAAIGQVLLLSGGTLSGGLIAQNITINGILTATNTATISNIWTYTVSPIVATPGASDNSNKAANTAWSVTYSRSAAYVPTTSSPTNCTAAGVRAQYSKVGASAIVFGSIDVTPASTGVTSFNIDLPIASNLPQTSTLNGSGTAVNGTSLSSVFVSGVVTNPGLATITFIAPSTTAGKVYFSFSYEIF